LKYPLDRITQQEDGSHGEAALLELIVNASELISAQDGIGRGDISSEANGSVWPSWTPSSQGK